jgi:hypothetical protein
LILSPQMRSARPLPSPAPTLTQRVFEAVSDPKVPAHTALSLCELLNAKREHVDAALDVLESAGKVNSVIIGLLRIYRRQTKENAMPKLTAVDVTVVVKLLGVFSRNSFSISREAAWKGAGYGKLSEAGHRTFANMERLGMIYNIESTYRIAPYGRKYLEEHHESD